MKHVIRFVGLALLLAGYCLAVPGMAQAALPEFTELVKKSFPAVVNIRTTRTARSQFDELEEEGLPEGLRRFFRDMPDRRPRPGAGSGFIIQSDGYILTNNHVVDGADEIIVALSDRREREAKIIGQDPLSDLALLKIDADDLPVLKIGSSEDLEPGQWVVAIGSPFGFEHSVTAGIVSAIGRSLPENNGNYVPFIQTDVAINPGNSGGPLLDQDGKVVGINSQIFTRSGGFMGLSFAIPIDVAMEVAKQLQDKGEVSRGWLGVLIQRVTRDLAESFGLDRPSGALVTRVFPDSPAERGGLKQEDIITSFNGHAIDLSSDLPQLVGRTRADSEVEVEIVRRGEALKLDIVVGMLEEENLGSSSRSSQSSNDGNRLGIVIVDLEDSDKQQLEVEYGVLVRRVGPGLAREKGIQDGDVITKFNGEEIHSAQQLEQLLAELPAGQIVPARVVRNKTPQYIALKFPSS